VVTVTGLIREALYETVIVAGLAYVGEVLETERVALCGERYAHLVDREASRAGHVASSLVLGGRRVGVKRPRVRSADGHELKLPSWQEWSSRDPLQQRSNRSAGHQQERGERALRLRHRAQVG
jgi:putative transposase